VAFPHAVGGLGVGHGPVALFLTFLIVIFVAYLTVTRKDVEELADVPTPPARSRHRRDVPSAGERRPVPPRPSYRSGPADEPPYRPRPGQSPYERGPIEESPGQAQPRGEEPRRPPEGFFVWDDR